MLHECSALPQALRPKQAVSLSSLYIIIRGNLRWFGSRRYRKKTVKTVETTSLNESRLDARFSRAQINKKLRGDDTVLTRAPVPFGVLSTMDKEIIQQINRTNNPLKVVDLIKRNRNNITHPSVFGKAMKACKFKKQYECVRKIMDESLKTDLPITKIQFTSFFDSMAYSDCPEICNDYLEIMINKYKESPDIPAFATLIKGCRFQPIHRRELAEKYWKMMLDHGLHPNNLVYNEMINIYAKAGDKERATKIFNQFLVQYDGQMSNFHLPTFNTYLGVFCKRGDVEGMQNVLEMMAVQKVGVSVATVSTVMMCYHRAIEDMKGLEFMKSQINEHITEKQLFHEKCVCLMGLIMDQQNNYSFNEKWEWYQIIKEDVGKYASTPSQVVTQLEAALALYRQNDPLEVVKEFKDLTESRKLISYKKWDICTQSTAIDLHCFPRHICQFILRYVIAFELKEMLSSNDKLILIVGHGKHSGGQYYEPGALKRFVIEDLLKFDPPINVEAGTTIGDIAIPRQQLIPYLSNDTNYAVERLTYPSDDWYLEDPRRDAILPKKGICVR